MKNLADLADLADMCPSMAICSQALICPGQSERLAHSRSFDLSDLSKWANEQMSDEQMSQFPTLLFFENMHFKGVALTGFWTKI